MLTTSSVKGARNCVDISSKELARYWCKRLKKSKPEIEGGNCQGPTISSGAPASAV